MSELNYASALAALDDDFAAPRPAAGTCRSAATMPF